jgi:phosphoglucosamine mutase
MCRQQKPLSELLDGFERYPQKLVNIKVRSKPVLLDHAILGPLLESKDKDMAGRGRLLVRYSGTEPKLRIMVQGDSDEFCEKHCTDIAEVVQREIGDV